MARRGRRGPCWCAARPISPLFAPVLEQFVAVQPGVRIDYEQWGVERSLRPGRARPRDGTGSAADLVISSAVDQMVKLVNDGCAQAHRSAETAALPAKLTLARRGLRR